MVVGCCFTLSSSSHTFPPLLGPSATPLNPGQFINGVAYADYSANPTAFTNQVSYAISYILTVPMSQVSVVTVGYYSRRNLLGTTSNAVIVQMTASASGTSTDIIATLNNAVDNGFLTSALAGGYQIYRGVATAVGTAPVVSGSAPSSASTATPPLSSSSQSSASAGISGCFAGTEQVRHITPSRSLPRQKAAFASVVCWFVGDGINRGMFGDD